MSVHTQKMTDAEADTFTEIHKHYIPKRKKRFATHDVYNYGKKIVKKDIELTQPIIDRAIGCLRDNGVTNFDENKWGIDFHQRNCGFEKKKYQWSWWHKDDYAVIDCKVHTVIFYLRKDITVGGGDFEYKKDGKIITHKVESKSILQFCGNLSHRPQETWGFGCRDIIVVFIRRT